MSIDNELEKKVRELAERPGRVLSRDGLLDLTQGRNAVTLR